MIYCLPTKKSTGDDDELVVKLRSRLSLDVVDQDSNLITPFEFLIAREITTRKAHTRVDRVQLGASDYYCVVSWGCAREFGK